MSKRGAGGGIKAAFARQAQRAEVAAQTATWPGLEAPSSAAQQVPEEYLQQLASKFEAYINKRDAIAKLAAKSSSRASLLPPRADADAAGPADQQTEVAKWQGNAAFCIQQLSMWPGSGVALQLQQQEVLLHIMVNCDLHLDPLLSTKAYSLLLRNLAKHPPVQLGSSSGSSQGGSQQQQQPPVLLCATNAGVCWQLFEHQSQPLLPDAPTPFPLLQQLVQNAVLLVFSGGPRSSAGQRGSSSKAASQGQALLLLYVVQLLQADLLVRQVAFERYMQLSKTAQGEGQKEEALTRAGTALQHSLLHRVMQDDSIGGDAWRFIPDSSKGKHQLVRDLLLLACSTGDGRDQAAPAKGAARAAATPPPAAAAAAAGQDTLMVDADAGAAAAAAADPAALQAPPAAAAAAAAAASGYGDAGVVPQQAPVVSAQELIQSARLLLLLLLQLYSSCEEAGLYGRGGEGRHHMQRQGGGGQPNDRFELDDVMMTAIGFCGHSAASFTLPQLAQHSNLQRLLAALPPVHRVRLLCLMVASVIHNRVVDPESEGKLALAPYNMELQGLEGYLHGKGRGHAGFRQPSAVLILQAVEARLEWAAKEMFGGKVLFPLLMATLVSAAAVTLRDAPDLEKQTFCQAATRVLDHVLLQGRDAFAVAAHMGRCEALAALAVAKQQIQSLC